MFSLKPHYNKRRPRVGAPQVLAYANFIGKRAPQGEAADLAPRAEEGTGRRDAAISS
mgnify:FL=1